MDDVAERLKKTIENLGLSFRDVEELTGISRSTIQRYVSGTTGNIPISKIQVFAKALGTTTQYLIGLESCTDEDDSKIIKKIGHIKPLEDIPEDISALNVFLYNSGEHIIKVEGKYYLGECGQLTESDIDYLKESAETALRVSFEMLRKKKGNNL